MIYSNATLRAVWLLLMLAVVLSGTGSLSGWRLLALVIAALVGPSLILRTKLKPAPARPTQSSTGAA
jgi:hypothetical protein